MINFIEKNKKMLMFIPIYLIYIVVVELIMGLGVENNSVWNKGKEIINGGVDSTD